MDPYNNCSHGSWLVLFFKTGMWKLEGCIKPEFFLLGVSVQNAAPAKRRPRVPVASCHCHSYSSDFSFMLCGSTCSILVPWLAPWKTCQWEGWTDLVAMEEGSESFGLSWAQIHSDFRGRKDMKNTKSSPLTKWHVSLWIWEQDENRESGLPHLEAIMLGR